jgi:hypothetical protein
METVYGTMKDLYESVLRRDDEGKKICRSESVLLRSSKTDLPLGAFAPDGGNGGNFYSRKNILKQYSPSHQYGDSMSAFKILYTSVLKAKGELK